MQWVPVTLCMFVVTSRSVTANITQEQAEALLAGNWENLGPVDGTVSIGSVPPIYSLQHPVDMVATESAKMFVELSRRMFPTGVFRIPPLDPYVNTKVQPVQVDHKYARGSISFSDLVVRGAKDFDLVDLRMRLNYPEGGTYRIDYNVTIPKLGFKSRFVTKILMGTKEVPVNLEGSIQVVLDEVWSADAVGARKVPRHGYVPDQVQLVGLRGRGGAKHVHVKLQLDNDRSSQVLSSNTLKLLYQFMKQDLVAAVCKHLLDLGNRVLKGFTVQQLHAALLYDSV